MPIEPPGATMPVAFDTLPSTEPWPRSMPPLATVTLPPSCAPGVLMSPTSSVPPMTAMLPVKPPLLPLRISRPAPDLVNAPLPVSVPA
ncbi:MAG: hypothetical protein WDO24_00180 [Pseudomonadota bacterium]